MVTLIPAVLQSLPVPLIMWNGIKAWRLLEVSRKAGRGGEEEEGLA